MYERLLAGISDLQQSADGNHNHVMRLIYITSSFPYGPGEAFVMPELAALQERGHDVLVVPMRPRGGIIHADAARFLSTTIAAGLLSRSIVRDCLSASSVEAAATCRVARDFARRSSTPFVKDYAVLPKALWLARRARLWGADHIHAFWASGPASFALAASTLSGISWSFTAHRFDIVENRLLTYKATKAQFVRFISKSGVRMAGLDAAPLEKKSAVVHLGVELKDRHFASSSTAVRLLCAGSLIPVKDHFMLLKAVELLRDRGVNLVLYLAGDGELRPRLEQEVSLHGLNDRVHFLGLLSHAALMELYTSGVISIAVLASADLGCGLCEGIPVSLMEAMSCGIPVVATATGGIPELLDNGAGWMVPARDPQALSDALQLLIQNPQLRQALGRAGQERIRCDFSASQVAQRLEELFAASTTAFSSHS